MAWRLLGRVTSDTQSAEWLGDYLEESQVTHNLAEWLGDYLEESQVHDTLPAERTNSNSNSAGEGSLIFFR